MRCGVKRRVRQEGNRNTRRGVTRGIRMSCDASDSVHVATLPRALPYVSWCTGKSDSSRSAREKWRRVEENKGGEGKTNNFGRCMCIDETEKGKKRIAPCRRTAPRPGHRRASSSCHEGRARAKAEREMPAKNNDREYTRGEREGPTFAAIKADIDTRRRHTSCDTGFDRPLH